MSALDEIYSLYRLVFDIVFFLPKAIAKAVTKARCQLVGVNLEDKVVVITGASSGIGEALAETLYAEGCRLILASTNVRKLNSVRDNLMQNHGRYRSASSPVKSPAVVQLDLSDPKSIQSAAKTMLDLYGHVDILVNNAGVSQRGSVQQTTVQIQRNIMEVNYFGMMQLTKELLPSLTSRPEGGQVVQISSVQGLISVPHRSAYSASKFAMQAFSDALRAEEHGNNLSVTVISPGYVNTNISINALKPNGDKNGVKDLVHETGYNPSNVAAEIREAIQLRQNEVVIAPFHAKFAVYLRLLCPALYFYFMEKRADMTKEKVG